MRLTILVRADKTGLGYQTRAYYKHLNPHKTVIIDLKNLNGNEQYYGWYDGAHVIKGIPTDQQIDSILDDTDVLLTAETPYNLKLYRRAQVRGVRTVCVENPEFYDHIKYTEYELPNTIILPSVWKQDEIRQHAEPKGTKVVQIHHPVDLDEFHFRQRITNKVIHIAGKPAAHDRNGTWDFLTACQNGVITCQDEAMARQIRQRYRFTNVFTDIADPHEIYTKGDILVLPRKYGGNCLPLNEALATGMPVIMSDIEPNNHILPKAWLAPAVVSSTFYPRGKVDIYTTETEPLRERIEWVQANIESQSKLAYEIAKTISWDTLKDKWLEALK